MNAGVAIADGNVMFPFGVADGTVFEICEPQAPPSSPRQANVPRWRLYRLLALSTQPERVRVAHSNAIWPIAVVRSGVQDPSRIAGLAQGRPRHSEATVGPFKWVECVVFGAVSQNDPVLELRRPSGNHRLSIPAGTAGELARVLSGSTIVGIHRGPGVLKLQMGETRSRPSRRITYGKEAVL